MGNGDTRRAACAVFATLGLVALPVSQSYAQAPPPPQIISISPITELPLTKPAGLVTGTEQPPALLPGPGGTRLLYLSTAWTWQCATAGNPLEAPVVLEAASCGLVDVPNIETMPKQYLAPSQVPPGHEWKRNYDGVFSAQLTHDSVTNSDVILTINHNEVKNEVIPGQYWYQSPFAPPASQMPSTCGNSGYTGRGPHGFETCWLAYGAFVSIEVNAYSPRTNYGRSLDTSEIGPVLWPTSGYFDLSRGAQGKLSSGLRHPSSIISGGYLYIYYLDTSIGVIGGRSALGTKVARAQISPRGLPGNFLAWDGRAFEVPELPAGFDKNNMKAFIAQRGPQVASLFAPAAGQDSQDYPLQSSHFSVAYDPRRHLYVGVEDYLSRDEGGAPDHVLALRLSSDLVHWSERTPLAPDARPLSYPEFANAAFTSNNEVDLSNLYIVGTRRGRVEGVPGKVNYVRVSLR